MADWLHSQLEQFRVPSRLVGKLTDHGAVPRQLAPIFRDRHDLAASHDLNLEIEEAIGASRFLIVLCSPAAASSPWINEEIACFKRVHREDRVLAAIVDGEPFASDTPGRAAEECFPPALRTRFDETGNPTDQRAEPIAADLRESADGRNLGLLKLAAGLMGVGLDDLAQREAQRRHRRLYLVTGASIAGMLFASGLAYTALDARDTAHEERRQAEGLIGFMLGDLRQKLEPLGRLDVLDAVGTRALSYYERQNKSDLSDASLAQRSRALSLMGEIAFTRGDLDGALRRYREAMASTGEAVRRYPDNPQSLFDHAQNIFWVGYIDYRRGDLEPAARAFREYRRLAERMVALAPQEPAYRLERIYAQSNLGTVLMDQRKYREASEAYQRLLEPSEALFAEEPANKDYQFRLLNALAWLAEAREYSGDIDEGMAHRQRQLTLLRRLWDPVKPDAALRQDEMTARRAMARMLSYRGQMPEAIGQARQAASLAAWLTQTESQNTEWAQISAQTNFDLADLELSAGDADQARAANARGCAIADRLVETDRSVAMWRVRLQIRCAQLLARLAIRSGDGGAASTHARRALVLARGETNPLNRQLTIAKAEIMLGTALAAAGQREAGMAAFRRAAAAWPQGIEERPFELADHALLLQRVGRTDEANALRRRLAAMGYRHPDYLRAA